MIEDIFEKSLKELQQGSSPKEVIFSYSENERNQLLPLLEIAEKFSKLPKNEIPQPAMQRKFMLAPVKTFWLSGFRHAKLATISMSVILLVTAIAGTGYAALNSVPGEALFIVKKSSEQVQLKLTQNPQAKMNLQLEISQRRLSEAERVLKNPSVELSQTQAAINELVAQTKNTTDEVQKVAQTNPKDTQPIVQSLENLTQQQQNLIKEIKPANEQTMVSDAEKTTQETSTKLAEIKKYLLAASNEQALVDLKKQNEQDKTEKDNAGQVESTSTNLSIEQNNATASTTATSTASSSLQSLKENQETGKVEKDPNTVTGTFIIEDPAPQFAP